MEVVEETQCTLHGLLMTGEVPDTNKVILIGDRDESRTDA